MADALQSVMKAGLYNQNAQTQTIALHCMMEMLDKAVELLPLPEGANRQLQVAEFGCSGGVNSIAPVELLAQRLDARLAAAADDGRPPLQLQVIHEDLPCNDFSALFKLLSDPQSSYAFTPRQHLALHYAAVGRSFYEQVFPDKSLTLAFSCCAVQWLSRAPMLLQNGQTCYWFSRHVTQEERASGAKQAAQDLRAFLELRGREFVAGGLLALTFIGASAGNDQDEMAYYFVDKMEAAWQQLISDGLITKQELAALSASPNYHRSLASSLAAVPGDTWAVLSAEALPLSNPAYSSYEAGSMSAAELGRVYSDMWRAINEAQQVALLEPSRGRQGAEEIVAEYYARLAAEVAADPASQDFGTVNLLLRRK